MPNSFAFLMLFLWPVVALVLFRTLPPAKALVWTILGGYLALPSATSVELPLVPALDKSTVPNLAALVFCLIFATGTAPERAVAGVPWRSMTGRKLAFSLFAVFTLSLLFTVRLNVDPIVVGPRFIPGLTLYDALSIFLNTLVSIIPFMLGWLYLSTQEAHAHVLRAFVIAALLYSLPVLFELRMSPQLHNWIYGFFPHSFGQHIRADGFRPVVFLNHGLMLGMLFSIAILCALVLWREALREERTSSGWLFAIVWLVTILLFSKNFGSVVITTLLGALIVFGGRRAMVTFSMVIAVIVMLYPMLRGSGFIPVDSIHEIARSIDEERAGSLKFRIDNENALLARANERPMFGWGSWGRNHIYESEGGNMISVSDGLWVILFGVHGWTGYIAYLGLLTLPILYFGWRRKELGPGLLTPGLLIILSASLIDMLPNAGLVPYVWLMAGAVTGMVDRRSVKDAGLTLPPSAGGAPRLPNRERTPPDWLVPPPATAGRRSSAGSDISRRPFGQ